MEIVINLFKGRFARGTFLMSLVGISLLGGLMKILNSTYTTHNSPLIDLFLSFMILVIALAILMLAFSIWAKRLHDINRSGWWSLLLFVPLGNLLLFVYLLFKKGDSGKNKYGAKPVNIIF